METHSYCNRRCSYCPNVVGDRLGANQFMPPDIWEKIIGGLEEIGYKESLVLNYYNEPLADRSILDRIREARARLPGARIMIFSNGDYLEPAFIDELAEAGLNYLHISVHLKRGDEYTDLYVINRITEISVRMGIAAKLVSIRSGEFAFATAPHRTMEIEVRGINFYKHGTDRGGLIDDIATATKRSAPCYFPFAHFVIGFNGLIAPCCHIRSDRPEHKPYIYGNVRDYESIFQAFTSAPAAAWRRELVGDQQKRSPCDTCAAGQLSEPAHTEAFVAAYHKYVVPPEAVAAASE
ncbi:MAG: radical domain protein [Phenylobacterium sp.]|nr:radical domain protein [Phenylobacterium sp.]